MKTASAMAGFDELKPYVPVLQREEKPIKVVADGNVNVEFYENDGKIGVMMMKPSDCEFVKGNAAFVFAESLENFYLRTNFSTVVKIDCDENSRQIFERLSRVEVASLSWWDGKVHKSESDIPVFHDEGEAKYFVQRDASAATDDDIGEDLIHETPSVMSALPSSVCHDDEIEAAVDAEIAARNGLFVVRHKNEMTDRYSYDVAIVGQRCFVIMHFGIEGGWLGDEELFNGDPPIWFSETDHTLSPVFFAQKWRELARERSSCLQVFPIVIASERSFIINEDEMENIWKNTCHVGVARTKPLEGSRLPVLKDYLDSLPAPKGSHKATHLETIREIDMNFLRKSWA